MISRHIMRSTARFPSAVGVGVPDDPFLRPPPTSPRSASPRRGGVPSPPGVTVSARPTAARRLRAAGAARKGGTPGEGSPFDPLLRFFGDGVFRALRRASKGSAPGPRPLFCKKAGQKTFKRQSTSSPNPSPLGRVIQSVREADTLAAEWQLPREWERRVGPETSRGRHHPKALFFGAPPRFFGQDQRNGVEQAAQGKDNRQQNGEFLQT